MSTVKLMLRTDADDTVTHIPAKPDTVDLDQLTPRARALAEAVAQMPAGRKGTGKILCHHRTMTCGEATPNPEVWLRPDQMDEPARMAWSAWDKYRADSDVSPVEYLERQARKIPHDWVIVSAQWITGPRQEPVPSSAASADDRYLTRDQVLDYMRARGRDISVSTWSAYTSRRRRQAPPADRHVGRTPQWRPETIDQFLSGEWSTA
jgi:hypothetical protein